MRRLGSFFLGFAWHGTLGPPSGHHCYSDKKCRSKLWSLEKLSMATQMLLRGRGRDKDGHAGLCVCVCRASLPFWELSYSDPIFQALAELSKGLLLCLATRGVGVVREG